MKTEIEKEKEKETEKETTEKEKETEKETEKEKPEPFIDVIKFNINSEKTVIAYTATWCKPCTRVKPFLLDYLNKYKIVSINQITKSYYKEHVYQFVPFFEVYDFKDNRLDSIQTSSEIVLKEFFEYNGIVITLLTDDF